MSCKTSLAKELCGVVESVNRETGNIIYARKAFKWRDETASRELRHGVENLAVLKGNHVPAIQDAYVVNSSTLQRRVVYKFAYVMDLAEKDVTEIPKGDQRPQN